MEKPKPDDRDFPTDPAPPDEPDPNPQARKPAKVTPLDEGKKVEEGIEIKET